MQISRDGLNHLIANEGAIPYVYDDGDGTWPKKWISSFQTKGFPTIGVGHRIFPSEQSKFTPYLAGGRKMTMREMQNLLASDINRRIAPDSWKAQIKQPVTQSMYDALVHQAFNTGGSASSIRKAIDAINRRDYMAAQSALASGPVTSKGVRLEGLVKRRAFEADLFMKDGLPSKINIARSSVPMNWIVIAYGAGIGLLLLLALRRRRQRRLTTTTAPQPRSRRRIR